MCETNPEQGNTANDSQADRNEKIRERNEQIRERNLRQEELNEQALQNGRFAELGALEEEEEEEGAGIESDNNNIFKTSTRPFPYTPG